jgi:hypothetical protein
MNEEVFHGVQVSPVAIDTNWSEIKVFDVVPPVLKLGIYRYCLFGSMMLSTIKPNA